MADNINLIVNETIENIVINPSITNEIVDITVGGTDTIVDISVTPNLTTVNVNKVIGVVSQVNSVNGQIGDVVLDIPSIDGLATITYVNQQNDLKVDKIIGYSLTKNDLTDILKSTYDNSVSWIITNGSNLINHLTNYSNPHQTNASQVGAYTTTQVDNIANSKVDKVLGKQLSTNDYTTIEKNKLADIAIGAEVNVNADWNAISGDALILNKPIIPSTTNFVPYNGAISDVNLGEFGIQLGNLEFDLTPTNTPTTVGSLSWNDSSGTLDLKLKGGATTLQIGQETVARIVNKTATNITLLEANYQAVRVTGAQGQRPKVDLAQANNDLNSTTTLGLVTETILINQEGFITTSGQVQQINTTGSLQSETWTDGDILYLSGTVAGRITNVKPIAPIHTVIIGFVEYAHAINGKIFVKVDNGYELEELHNVSAIAPNNNEVLTYDSVTTLWKPKTVINALGYTPYNSINPNQYTANTGTVTNVSELTLGTIGNDISSSVANGTTTPVITLNIPTASALNRGALSSTDWSTFNNKQNTITPESLTKVDDTNVTLTLGGSPTNALLQGVSLTLGWIGTLADLRIASASTWNAKQNALSGTGFVKSTLGVISYDTNTYITGNQSISLSGAMTGSGTTSIVTTLSNSIVGIANLTATGTPSATTYLRGDNTWATVSVGGSTLVVTNRQTASYTLVLTDLNKLVEMNVATANNLTIPLSSSVAFAIGTKLDIVQYGTGQTTFVATNGVTIRSANNWLKMNSQYGAATLTKIGANEWYLWGNLNA